MTSPYGVWLTVADEIPNAAMLDYTTPGWVRLPLNWDKVEVAPGIYDWDRYDNAFHILHQRGITILPCVTDPPFPGVYTVSPDGNCGALTLQGEDGLRNFLKSAMKRYGTLGSRSVQHWQILNEPDWISGPGFGGGCLGGNPLDYLPFLQAAYSAKLIADPYAQIVFAAVSADSCWAITQQSYPGDAFNCDFVPHLLDAGAGAFFDVMAFNQYHWYRRGYERPNFISMIGKVDLFRNWMADHGLSKPIIITESGREFGRDPGATELRQSLQMADVVAYNVVWTTALASSRNRSPLLATIHFAMQNGDKDKHGWYGLFQRDGTPGYGAIVYRYMTQALEGCTLIQDASEPTVQPNGMWLFDTLQHWRFIRPDGREVRCLWIDSGRGDVVSTPATRSVPIDGNVISSTTAQGATLPMNNGRLYVTNVPAVVVLE